MNSIASSKVSDRRLVRNGVFMFMAGGVVTLLVVLIMVALLSIYVK